MMRLRSLQEILFKGSFESAVVLIDAWDADMNDPGPLSKEWAVWSVDPCVSGKSSSSDKLGQVTEGSWRGCEILQGSNGDDTDSTTSPSLLASEVEIILDIEG